MRLKSNIWVAAYIRRCQTENIFAVVRRHGADEAGADDPALHGGRAVVASGLGVGAGEGEDDLVGGEEEGVAAAAGEEADAAVGLAGVGLEAQAQPPVQLRRAMAGVGRRPARGADLLTGPRIGPPTTVG